MAGVDPGSRAGIPGLVDRKSFFEAQRRHRRATWRLSAPCAFAAVVMGIPLSLVLTPLLYALALLVVHFIDLIAPLPDGFWQDIGALASLVMTVIGGLLGEEEPASLTQTLLGLAAMLVPGALAMVLIWLGLSSLFVRAGVGACSSLLKRASREPTTRKKGS
jgi:hypothetical protein